jgi:Ca2+-binding RTX toxin-like protein
MPRRLATIRYRLAFALGAASLALSTAAMAGVDVRVNDPAVDNAAADQTTQSETSLVVGPNGEICAGFNDFGPPAGLSGLARSTNFGATWTDVGGINESGDPVLAYHGASDTYFYASLGGQQIRVARSTDGCQTFTAAVNASTLFNVAGNNTTLADKPWIAIDNNGGANDGNVYVCFTRFYDTSNPLDGTTDASELRFMRSTDGGNTYTNEQVIGANGTAPFGCNVQVGSDGGVNVTWARRDTDDIVFRRSTDAGLTFGGAVTVNSAATREPGTDTVIACGAGNNRPTLTGNIRMLHQAWMATDTSGGPNDGNLYIVWASDPAGTPDNSDVFFSRSTNDGATWSAMTQIGAGGGATDQFEPNVAVNDAGDVAVAWYDRRNDVANNTNIDVYTAFSADGGATFQPIVRVTDVSFGVPQLLPNFNPGAAQCYMGEYIGIAGAGASFYYLWGDNRDTVTNANWPAGRPDPNIYFDVLAGPTPLSCQNGLVATIVGTAGNDDLMGTPGDDVIFGLGGNDRITGLGGNDTICGGPGDDEIYGMDGNDTLYGDAGNDKISGGNGNDSLFGGPGIDRLTGDAGDDFIDAGDGGGGDSVFGGAHVNGDACILDAGDINLGGCNP